ncbi:MAG: YegS/Rv2252/BmrU family lipid kinase [Actinobacteria bacterium]|nr:YegS/Rv2252/BmrU family lipid kinase [Actinomycetota bacterium]
MTSPFGPILFIANPRAGRGRNAALPRVTAACDARGLAHRVALTRGPGDASRLATEAVVDQGIRFVVAVGGDGTVHEVVNGLVDARTGRPHAEGIVFGAVAGGSGCDFIRTFGLDRSPERAVARFEGETVFPIDLGRVTLLGKDGAERTVLFANIAEAGYGGLVTDLANRMPRVLGKSRYLIAIMTAIRRFELVRTQAVVDHTTVEEPLSNVIVANCQFFGGGLKVAPRALPDDGTFNVQLWRGEVKDVFLLTSKMRVGEHLTSPDVREYQSTTVTVDAERPLLVEADGEVLGTTPARFDVLPKVLDLKI